jgi:hypothetical protein
MVNTTALKNNEIQKSFNIITNVDPASGEIPNRINESIQPVIILNNLIKPCNIAFQNTATNSTNSTIYTTPTNADFYLCSISLGAIKDVTATSTASSISGTIGGVSTRLVEIPFFTLTAGSGSNSITFNPPLKMDRGTGITVNNTTSVANVTAWGGIAGFTYDNNIYNLGEVVPVNQENY